MKILKCGLDAVQPDGLFGTFVCSFINYLMSLKAKMKDLPRVARLGMLGAGDCEKLSDAPVLFLRR
jgi:hypothetical protein